MLANIKKLSEFFVYICGILLFSSVLLISTEVVLRKFFLVSFGGADEISGYILGISISWSLAYVLFEKMHIRIDVIYTKLSLQIQKVLDLIALLFSLAFVGILTYFAYDVISTSILKNSTANTPLATPLWIPQFLWGFGLAFFLVVITLLIFEAFKSVITKKDNSYTNIEKDEIQLTKDDV
jgi:TRAP-type C4-dicarboxylate transport system permease small subunit